MALSNCVHQVLCTLSAPVLQILDTLIDTVVTTVNVQLAALNTQLTVLDLALAPITIAKDLAEQALATAQAPLGLLPTNLIAGCADLGDIMSGINDTLATATATLEEYANDATRLLAVRARIAAEIATLQAQLLTLTELRVVITECITEVTTI